MRLTEFSPDTFDGSITEDLITSKIWVCKELKKLNLTEFDTTYILGSWYGIMSYTLNYCDIKINKIINVDVDKNRLNFSNKLLQNFKNVVSMNKDANELNYQQLTDNSLIINTSTNEITGTNWLDNIPNGTIVVIQGRNDVDEANNLEKFDNKYNLSKTLYLGQLSLEDPETEYHRFMKIGIK